MRRLFWIAWLVGCTATPLPEAPFEGDFEFMPATGSLPFIAVEGTIDPDHRLRIWELDTMAPAQTITPNADGSIDGTLSAPATRARLEVIAGNRRSLPLDVNVVSGARLSTSECVAVFPQHEVDGVHLFELRNDCDAPIDVAFRTRVIAPIEVPAAREIAVGESATLELRATASTDEIVVIDVTGAVDETRYLTVYTR